MKRIVLILGGLVCAAVGLTALLYLCGLWLRPDVTTRPEPPPAAELAVVEAARRNARSIDVAHPPVITRSVDYTESGRGAWWPRHEAPVLAELAAEGQLPPVAERVGPEPTVIQGVEGTGRYGGGWYRLVNSNFDISTVAWLLSSSGLVRWSPQGYPLVPHVAKSWTVSPDFTDYVFTLRKGMRWSDGVPVTSDDIVYWYENEVKYFNLTPLLLRAGPSLGRVEKIDELRVRFVFSEPNPLFIERLASTGQIAEDFSEYIVPAHYLRQYHPALGDRDLIRRTQVALGLSSPVALYKRMKHYLNPAHPRIWPWIYHTSLPTSTPQTFVRNPYYFAVDAEGNQLPYLDRLTLEIKSSNLVALSVANGEPSMQDRNLRYEDQTMLLGGAAHSGYEIYYWKSASQSTYTIFPNLNRRVDPARPETAWKHELLTDRRFRQALSLAINRRDIIDGEFNGETEPAQLDPGLDSPYHNPRLFHAFTDFDPARANRLLDEIGLTRRDSEHYRTFPDGSRMSFRLNLTDFSPVSIAQLVVEDWARVGVRLIPHVRARRLFDQEKLAHEHDFTVWTGESEFYPLVEPRNFVPTYGESYYAPAFGEWYRNGGIYGDLAALRPNSTEPPPGHPLRRAMEILNEINMLPDEAARRARFAEILDLAAENLWTINISTAPPKLVMVKNGFHNVPRTAMSGGKFQTPGNTGIETYYWDQSQPPDTAAVSAQTKHDIIAITPPPHSVVAGPALKEGTPGGPFALMLRGLFGAVAVTAGVLLGLRHPFIGRRLLLMLPAMAAVSLIVFVLVKLPPGDFADTRATQLEMQGTRGSDQLAADLRKDFHLDDSPLKQYARWVGLTWFTTFKPADAGLLQGNLGLSMELEMPVADVIGDRIWLTVVVSLATLVFTWVVALPIGIYSAVRRYSPGDYVFTLAGFFGVSVPPFLLALVLMFLAKRWWGVNVSGLFSPEFSAAPDWTWAKVGDLLTHIWLPVIVLGFAGTAGMIRVMRANLLDELKKPYVMTARAKGLRPLRLLLKYPVRLAFNPFVSGLGGLFPQLISGGAIVAMILSLPMIGPTMVDALLVEDVYLAGSMLLVLSLLGMLGTLVSDLLLLWLDPRIRLLEDAG